MFCDLTQENNIEEEIENNNTLLQIIETKSHEEWKPIIKENLDKVSKDIELYYSDSVCYPPKEFIFTWSEYPISNIKVVIVGQDPYIKSGQAHGLSFSVSENIKVPPSLRNVYKAIEKDTGIAVEQQKNGNLLGWSNQGILLLNATLTVKEGKSNSHAKIWKNFTENILKHVAETQKNIVFLLWGNFAQTKSIIIEPFVEENEHLILKDGHPSPLNTKLKFIGTNCFTKTNEFLKLHNRDEIIWHNHLT